MLSDIYLYSYIHSWLQIFVKLNEIWLFTGSWLGTTWNYVLLPNKSENSKHNRTPLNLSRNRNPFIYVLIDFLTFFEHFYFIFSKQKFETIVCCWNNGNSDKLTWKILQNLSMCVCSYSWYVSEFAGRFAVQIELAPHSRTSQIYVSNRV